VIVDEAGILAADGALDAAGGADRLETLRRLSAWSRRVPPAAATVPDATDTDATRTDAPSAATFGADAPSAATFGADAVGATTPAADASDDGVGASPADPFAAAAGTRVLAADGGAASLAMTVPRWLTGPAPGPRLGTMAVAALAEMALAAAAGAGLGPTDVIVTTSLQLRALGPVTGWPDAEEVTGRGPATSMFAPDPTGTPPPARPLRLRAHAAADARDDEPTGRLRRATGTVSTPDGRPLAEATALCAVLRPSEPAPARADDDAGPDRPDPVLAGRPAPAGPAGGPADGSATSDGSVRHQPPAHPLLDALGADVRAEGDRLELRLAAADWLADRLGRVHAAACCALADAAVSTALARRLPTGSATHVLSLDLTVIRSLPLAADVAVAATVRHVGRRLAVVDVELGLADAPPSVLARTVVTLGAHRRP